MKILAIRRWRHVATRETKTVHVFIVETTQGHGSIYVTPGNTLPYASYPNGYFKDTQYFDTWQAAKTYALTGHALGGYYTETRDYPVNRY